MTLQDTDKFLVNRNGSSYHLEAQNLMAELLDDDLMLVNRAGKSYKATGAEIKGSLGPKGAIFKPSILAPGQNAGIGELSYYPKTSEITNIAGMVHTVQDDQTYNADGGANMGQPISETFLDGDIVKGIKPGVPAAVGTLVGDATGNRVSILAYPEADWKTSNMDAAGGGFRGVAYGDGVFVAVSHNGTSGKRCAVSTNGGETWTPKTTIGEYGWNSIAYGNGVFVALASNQIAVSSNKGNSWTRVAPPENSNWQHLIFGAGKFVAVGKETSNRVMYSTDGISWTAVPAAENNWWRQVAYGDGHFVAVSSDGTNQIMWANANDLTTWYPVNIGSSTIAFTNITYGNRRFVGIAAGGIETRALWADIHDLNTWNVVDTGFQLQSKAFTYAYGQFLVCQTTGYLYSADGDNWFEDTPPAANSSWSVATAGNGRIVCVASSGSPLCQYTDAFGSPWLEGMEIYNESLITEYGPDADELEFVGSIPAGTDINTWGDARWEVSQDNFGSTMVDTKAITVPTSTQSLLPADRTNIVLESETTYQARLKYTSTDPLLESEYSDVVTFKTKAEEVIDLTDWGLVNVGNTNWRSIAYGNGNFVAGAQNGVDQIMCASDPAGPWTKVTPPETGRYYALTFGNGQFVAISSYSIKQIIYATDPKSPWTAVAAPENNSWISVAYGNGQFVAVAQDIAAGLTNDIMYASNPGGPWTLARAPEHHSWTSITYGDGKFVAVNSDGTNRLIYASENDLNNWIAVPGLEANPWRSITYGGGQFVAVADTGTKQIMYASNPAGPWTAIQAPEANSWESITYGNGQFVAVASGGTNCVMHATNPAGPWTVEEAPEPNGWGAVTYGDGQFVSVAYTGTNRVMYTKKGTTRYYDETNQRAIYDQEIVARFGIDPETTNLEPYGIAELTEQPDYPVAGYTPDGDKYRPIEDLSGVVAALEAEVATLTDG